MNRVQQKQIVDEMLEGLKESLYKRLDIVPESWDGIELRWWLYDTVEVQFVSYINSNYKRNLLVQQMVECPRTFKLTNIGKCKENCPYFKRVYGRKIKFVECALK